MRNDTAQQLDPLGGITARVFAIGAVITSLFIAALMSVASAAQTSNPLLEVLGLLALAAAGAYYIRAVSPFRAPFPRSAHAVVCLLALAASLLNSLAQWGTNDVVRDDWGPMALAVLTLTFGSWRPAWEIAVCTVVCSVLVGSFAFVQAGTFGADVPAIVFAIIPATPVLAAGAAASVFSYSLVSSLLAWRDGLGSTETSTSPAAAEGEPTPVPTASHLQHLDEQVYPFLERVASGSEVSAADGDRARTLARELRTLLVLDAERSWLSRLARQTNDAARFAERMNDEERGFVRALVAHVRNSAAFDDSRMRLALHGTEWEATCTLEVPCVPGHNPRVQLAPYIAVARSVFGTVSWNLGQAHTLAITLTFDPNARESMHRDR